MLTACFLIIPLVAAFLITISPARFARWIGLAGGLGLFGWGIVFAVMYPYWTDIPTEGAELAQYWPTVDTMSIVPLFGIQLVLDHLCHLNLLEELNHLIAHRIVEELFLFDERREPLDLLLVLLLPLQGSLEVLRSLDTVLHHSCPEIALPHLTVVLHDKHLDESFVIPELRQL